MVPEYHVMMAAAEANYKYYNREWLDLGWREKAAIVALYFAKTLIHNHNEDAQATAAQKRTNSAQTKKG